MRTHARQGIFGSGVEQGPMQPLRQDGLGVAGGAFSPRAAEDGPRISLTTLSRAGI